MKGIIRVVRGSEVKLTLPGPSVTIKSDGTIWYQGMPILGITDPVIKAKVSAAIKAKRYGDIPAESWTRLGDNPNGLWAGDEAAWATHPAKLAQDEKNAARREQETKQVTIWLSSRGWGDFIPAKWIGDITRPDAEILAECKEELRSGYDVDEPNQTDDEILSKITAARTKWATPKQPYKEPVHGPGYCYSCKTYCYGDCGDYHPARDNVTVAREISEIAREIS